MMSCCPLPQTNLFKKNIQGDFSMRLKLPARYIICFSITPVKISNTYAPFTSPYLPIWKSEGFEVVVRTISAVELPLEDVVHDTCSEDS